MHYGKVVTNYTAGDTTWQVFYADNSNIYLITESALTIGKISDKISGYNGSSDFASDLTNYPAVQAGWLNNVYSNGSVVYSSSFYNMKGTQYLLDKTKWATYVNSDYADYAIGGPTLEMLSASLQAGGKEAISCYIIQNYGYCVNNYTNNEDLATGSVWNNNLENSYWLACPSHTGSNDLRRVYYTGTLGKFSIYAGYQFRPVVCLNTNATLKLIEGTDGAEDTYEVSIAQ